MGILNLTPDSFYPGSRLTEPAAALAAAREKVEQGADLLDLGAESSRPGSDPVGAAEEQRRLLPVLDELRGQFDIPITVDTTRADTAALVLAAGADGINDISAGTADPGLLSLVARHGAGIVLMHKRGTPKVMQEDPRYEDVVAEISAYLAARVAVAEQAGIAPERIAVDPGIGFGKNLAHNLALLGNLGRVGGGRPVLLGASRKSFIEHLTGAPVADRLGGSLAAVGAALAADVSVVRVHDVAETVQFLDTVAAIQTGEAAGATPQPRVERTPPR